MIYLHKILPLFLSPIFIVLALLAVGVGYAAQRVERLPRDPWDEPLDALVCDDAVRHFA